MIPERSSGERFKQSREHGMHALRHCYASVLPDAGENVKALAEYLRHADPGFTPRTCTHLLPNSQDRARKAVTRRTKTGGMTQPEWAPEDREPKKPKAGSPVLGEPADGPQAAQGSGYPL
ncbi:tyrosine-type recombinase/integrase [Streptomyces sp. CA-106110]|uniref:tyrosine-type recombinase/integrase n=1 Tax=Streptomyces sp. CA-106110 TaxID=3240044 RepID=UPI003D8C40F8